MEKNTVIAVILSVVIITASFILQGILFPQDEQFAAQQTQQQFEFAADAEQQKQERGTNGETTSLQPSSAVAASSFTALVSYGSEPAVEPFSYGNELYQVVFDPRGGRILSLKLREYSDGDDLVDMVIADPDGRAAFDLSFGGPDQPIIRDALYRRSTGDPDVIEFYRDFQPDNGEPFTLVRRYRFFPGEYVFRVETELVNSVNQLLPLNINNAAYTLHYGPQIGPNFETLDNRTDYRRFTYHDGSRSRDENLQQGNYKDLTVKPKWAAVNGKYFATIGVPGVANYIIRMDTRLDSPLPQGHTMSFIRAPLSSSRNVDTLMFYAGPKIPAALNRYDNASDNALGISGMEFDEILDTRFLGWFENILKVMLETIYRFVPNYGVSIVILTVLVKLLLWPLTKKSFESNAKSQALQPKITELREKYKDKPEKMNQELMALYKKEGVNPIGGCLPLVLQMPLLLAMFGLFNNHFDLRGAVFISGWINDLAAPESIFYFGEYFSLPILGWTDIRLLPILFVSSQILTSKYTQPAGGGGNSQAKMLTTFMPIMFFFILYNMPSGLLVYWIITNILSVVQQLGTNKYREGHPMHEHAKKKQEKGKK
ncbi:membrane protein insertase YidC [Spirochaeta dissipatitropha]